MCVVGQVYHLSGKEEEEEEEGEGPGEETTD